MDATNCCLNPSANTLSCFLCNKKICENCRIHLEGKEICSECFVDAQIELQKEQEASSKYIISVAIGGVVLAFVAAFLWAFLVIKTGYISGFYALGVGFLIGYGVHLLAGKRRALGLQIVAAVCTAFAICLGQYLTSIGMLGLAIQEKIPEQFTWFTPILYTQSLENYWQSFDFFYLLMLAIACYYAWWFNKPRGLH